MKNWRVFLVAVAAAVAALVLSPGVTRADDLTGSVGISWLAGGSTFASDTIAVGSSISCSSSSATSPICAGYSDGFTVLGTETFGVSNSPSPSISYSVSGYPTTDYGGSVNGFDFTGLTFASGEPLSGFTIADNTIGLTDGDITMGTSSIFINLAGLPVDGTFTIDLIPSTVAAPEPSSFLLLGLGLIALAGLARKRFASDRFMVESAS